MYNLFSLIFLFIQNILEYLLCSRGIMLGDSNWVERILDLFFGDNSILKNM